MTENITVSAEQINRAINRVELYDHMMKCDEHNGDWKARERHFAEQLAFLDALYMLGIDPYAAYED